MLLRIAVKEFRYLLFSPMMIVSFAIFFLLPFFSMVSDNVQFGAGGNVLINSPYAIMVTLMLMSVFSVFAAPSFTGTAVLRDVDHKMDGIIFSLPISKPAYLMGRFLGSYAAFALCMTSIPLGMFIGSLWPNIDPETLAQIGPSVGHYVFVYAAHILPVMLLMGAMFFALAIITRSIMVTYLAAMGFLMLFFIGLSVLNGPDFREISALLDPYGFRAFTAETQYWSAFERNERILGWSGLMLANRLIWLGVSFALLGLAYFLFSFRKPARMKKSKQSVQDTATPSQIIALPRIATEMSDKAMRAMLWQRMRFEVRSVVMSLPFMIIIGFSIFLAVIAIIGLGLENGYGVDAYPVTRLMVQSIQGGFTIGIFVVLIFYGADLVWRERSRNVNEILDATPTPSWVFVTAKLTGLITIILAILLVGILMGLGNQVLSGHDNIDLALYIHRILLLFAVPLILIAILSVTVQVLSRNRFIGMMIMVLFLIGQIILNQLGFEHPLYQFASGTPTPLSDMNGSGRFLTGDRWLQVYWGFFCILLLTLIYILWNRGLLQSLRSRLPLLRQLRRPVYATAFGLGFVGWVGTGSFIFYNTNILNEYLTSDDRQDLAVAYEEKYRQYEDLPMPKTISVNAKVDIYSYRRRVEVSADQVLENKTDQTLETVHLVFPQGLRDLKVDLEGANIESVDERYNYYILTLDRPMAPGEQRAFTYAGVVQERGFSHSGINTGLVRNGTFLNNAALAPYIGFNPGGMLSDRNTRRRKGLEPLPRQPKLEEAAYWNENYIRGDSDFIDFKTTVSTVADQIVIAPGYLQKEWAEGDRRYFEYEMDAPILNFYSYLSADYKVVRERWNDIDIEVYHHAPHDYNVARMIDSVKDSVEYFSKVFSPYQHRQVRILEFPAYATFAQAFPNTIPYSEGIGFIADIGEGDVDIAYYVTAHEVAHQWWAHQVMGSNNQGSTMLSETLAQYGALLVMEQEYGPAQIRQFLKRELDTYLRGRAGDPEGELPLYLVENQAYIHYRKGAVVMYALKDYLGEEVVNTALSRLIELRAFSGEPYARSTDLLRLLKEEAGPEHEAFITDMLEKITLYDLKAADARAEPTQDGKWRVVIDVTAEKFYADTEGREVKADFDIPVDIGIFTKSPAVNGFVQDDVLHLAKQSLTLDQDGKAQVELIVDQEPTHMGIDPYNKLIDRNSDDNIKSVDVSTELASAQ